MASKVDSSGLSVISEEKASARKHLDDDYESVYSNHKTKGSVYGGGHKKKLHPLMLGPSRQNPGKIISLHAASKNNLSEFTQRIMSAKLIRTKQVQNQLNETQNQLNELINENRILRNLLKRQEGALKKYEGNHAELPQLIRSHNEEIRALKANNKLIKAQLRESNTKLKDRENELEALRDNYNKLKKLSTEKNLLEREKLQKKVEELQDVIKEQEEKIQVLSRKVLLESKNYRHHLNIEVIKHKETQKDLTSALSMISKLEKELLNKDKQLPSGNKVLLKRESKNFMPVIVSKSTDIQPKLGVSEDSFLSRDERGKSHLHDSPESELELLMLTLSEQEKTESDASPRKASMIQFLALMMSTVMKVEERYLNCLESSDDTPSPIQDIFPEINGSKKPSPEMKTSTEITYSKSEMIHLNNEYSIRSHNTLKPRKNSLSKKNSRIPKNPELDAKTVAETISQDINDIDNLAQKVQASTLVLENKEEVNSLLEELKTNVPKPNLASISSNSTPENEENSVKTIKQVSKRNVPKRKLEEDKGIDELKEKPIFDHQEELTKTQQQKLENMTKTWNSLKSKIQEDRMKAEEKMKELQKLGGKHSSDEVSSEGESEKIEEAENDLKEEPVKELKFVNFTDDAYILQELQKTDKIFNKLKNETKKVAPKTPSSASSITNKKSKANASQKSKPKEPPDIQNFRTQSRREPKYLEEFQKEYQKQNLLKALKAIDVGKDPNLSSDESGESDSEPKKEKPIQTKNGLKHIRELSSNSDKGLMAELFGSKHRIDKHENLNLEYGTIASVNE